MVLPLAEVQAKLNDQLLVRTAAEEARIDGLLADFKGTPIQIVSPADVMEVLVPKYKAAGWGLLRLDYPVEGVWEFSDKIIRGG